MSSSPWQPAAVADPQGCAPAGVHALHFEGFVVLPGERRLLAGGEPAKIGSRALDLLLVLLASRDRVVSKDELLERVWPGLVVEENNLSVHVSQLRKVCGPQVISTVPGRGYQFTAASVAADGRGHAAGRVRERGGADEFAADPGLRAAPRGNLPASLPPLLGRDAELDEVLGMLEAGRWVTITGAGGMGKTRLAEMAGMQTAARMPAWLVELASVNDPRFVPNTVAQTLGTTIVDTQRPLDSICAALQGQPALLILDNCEHLLAAVTLLCCELLRELPLLRVLVTSQELLRGTGEAVYKLGPLTLPDPQDMGSAAQTGSVRLLRERVRALSRHFEISAENIHDAAIICRQLDGLPLAIELAAGRVPMLGLAGVRARLGQMFRLLTGDARVRLRRHQTLRAALDWSFQLLLPAEQALLCRLGAFTGTFSVEGVRQIADDLGSDEWEVLDTLGSLIDKSLVQVKGVDRPRYLMLETTRAYALEQLATRGDTRDALSRHARATQRVCALATRRRDTQAIWDEIANIRAAFAWAMSNEETELAVALVNVSSVVLALGGLVGEVVQRLVEVEPCVTERLPRPLAAQYWQWLGRFGNDGRLPARRCVAALQVAEGLFRELANHRHVHACLRMRAEALVEQGDVAGARQAVDCARQLETDASPMADRMRRLRIEAKILEGEGSFPAAVQRLEQALEMARLADIQRYVATLMQDMGQTLLHAGDAAGAQRCFRAVVDDAHRDLSVTLAVAYARMGLATALLAQDHPSAARAAALEAVPLLRSCGILLAHSEVFAWLLAALGQRRCAGRLLSTADSFRSFSHTMRGAVQARAMERARELLAAHGPADDDADGPIGSDAELAQVLVNALAGAGTQLRP